MNAGTSSRGSPGPKSMTGDALGDQPRLGLGQADERVGLQRLQNARLSRATAPPARRSERTSAATATCSSRVCAKRGSPGPEVHRVDAGERELGDRRPRLLGLATPGPCPSSARRRGLVRGGTSARRRVGEDLDVDVPASRSCRTRSASSGDVPGRVAVVQVRLRAVRDDVLGDAALDLRHRHRLDERQALELALDVGLVGHEPGPRRRAGGSRSRRATAAPSARCARARPGAR